VGERLEHQVCGPLAVDEVLVLNCYLKAFPSGGRGTTAPAVVDEVFVLNRYFLLIGFRSENDNPRLSSRSRATIEKLFLMLSFE